MDHPIIIIIFISSHQAHTYLVSIKTIFGLRFPSHISSHSTFRTLEVQWVLQNLVQSMEQPMILLDRSDLLDVDQM